MIYAIGDIHGERWKLERLWGKIRSELKPEDLVVFVGDYVDRGPDSAGVIDLLLAVRAEHSQSVFLRGNHEQLMLLARQALDPDWDCDLGQASPPYVTQIWLGEGGIQTLKSYEVRGGELGRRWWELIPDEHWEFLKATNMEHTAEHFHFVHAGLAAPSVPWAKDELQRDPRLWIREPFLSYPELFDGRVVVFGHTPQSSGRPLIEANKVGIDTGAAYGGPLTCVVLDDGAPYDRKRLRVLVA